MCSYMAPSACIPPRGILSWDVSFKFPDSENVCVDICEATTRESHIAAS